MATSLTRLALTPSDSWALKPSSSAQPSVKYTVVDGVHMEDDERERVSAMISECHFTQTVLMNNFEARLRSGLPPTGYAATWSRDSVFVADVFDHNLFRGVASVSLDRKRPPDHSKLQNALADLNALFGDGSPVPILKPDQKGNWVCSLGPFAWVGMYHQQHPEPPFAAVVVAGLDAASWDALRGIMRTKWHRKLTMEEVYKELEPWRALAAKNRERILATFQRVMGEPPKDVGKMLETTVAYEARPCVSKSESALSWFKNATVRVPTWFRFPAVSPTGCDAYGPGMEPGMGVITDHARSEIAPWEVRPEFDVYIDDVVRYGECEYVRLAGCCDSTSPVRVVVRGPRDEILTDKTPGSTNVDTLNAWAAQAIQRPSLDPVSVKSAGGEGGDDGVLITWEDPGLNTNRLVHSVFAFHTDLPECVKDAKRLMPACVRVSCRDSTNRAESGVQKTRLASLAMDEWVPLRR